MNKLIGFPLVVMVIAAIISFLSGGDLTPNDYEVTTNGSQTINGTSTSYSGSGGLFNFNLFSGDGLLVTMILVVALVIIMGIMIFGSGTSMMSQVVTMKSVGYLGLWAALSIIGSSFLTTGTGNYGVILWFCLTLMYGVGFIKESTSVGGV